jgi:hypothetical protein
LIAWRTTTIFRRAISLTSNTSWVRYTFFGREDFLQFDGMMPIVPEIVDVKECWFCETDELGYFLLPAGEDYMRSTEVIHKVIVFGRNADKQLLSTNVFDVELVKVIIQPSHSILYCYMQIPEDISAWDLDSAPDRWLDVLEGYLELIDLFLGRHALPRLEGDLL